MRRHSVLLVVAAALAASTPAAVAAVDMSPAATIAGPVSGSREQVPLLVELSAQTLSGEHVAAFLDASSGVDRVFGRLLRSNGTPRTPAVRWSVGDTDVFNADAAVGGDGTAGLAFIHQDRADDPAQGDLFVRPFDPATAQPTGEQVALDRATFLYGAEPYLDGYYVMYRRRIPGTRSQHVLQRLDASGAPVGEPRELSRSRNGFRGVLYGDRSRRRLAVVSQPFTNVVDFELFGPDRRIARRRLGGVTNDFLLDVARASGGAWMTLWARQDPDAGTYRAYTRQLSADAEFDPPRFLPLRPSRRQPAGNLAFNDQRGLVVLARGGRCPAFTAIQIDRRGRADRGVDRLTPECRPPGRLESFFSRLVRAARGRFVLGFSTYGGGGGEHVIRAAGLKISRRGG
jgi:hypothetical protein